MPKFYGKVDTYLDTTPKSMRRKLYSGRIKATKGLHNVADPTTKAVSHRIVRRKLKREMNKDTEL